MNARLADQNRKHKILFQALLDKRKCKTYCKSYDLDLCWYLGDYRKYHIEIKKTHFLARRDECPESYCHPPGVGVGVGVCVRVHKNFNLAYNFLTNTDWAFIFHMCIPCGKTFFAVR